MDNPEAEMNRAFTVDDMTDAELAGNMCEIDSKIFVQYICIRLKFQPEFEILKHTSMREVLSGWTERIHRNGSDWSISYLSAPKVLAADTNAEKLKEFEAPLEFNYLKESIFGNSYNPDSYFRRDNIIRRLMHLPEPLVGGFAIPLLTKLSEYCFYKVGTVEEMDLRACMRYTLWLMPPSTRSVLYHMVNVFHDLVETQPMSPVDVGRIFAPILTHDCPLARLYSSDEQPKDYEVMVAIIKYMVECGVEIFDMPIELKDNVQDYLRDYYARFALMPDLE